MAQIARMIWGNFTRSFLYTRPAVDLSVPVEDDYLLIGWDVWTVAWEDEDTLVEWA